MAEAPRPLRLPVEHLGNGNVLIRADAIDAAKRLMQLAASEVQRRDRVPLSPMVRALLYVTEQAAAEANGLAALLEDETAPVDPRRDDVELIGSAEAAAILGCSSRHVSRIPDLIGERRGRDWLFDRSAVEALAARRSA